MTEQLGYFKGGFATVISKLDEALKRRNVTIRTGVKVERISDNKQVSLDDGTAVAFDVCIFTGASPLLASLLPPVLRA